MFKKLIITLFLSLSLVSIAHAENRAVSQLMKDSIGTDISSFALSTGVSVNSERIFIRDSAGFSAVLITVDATGDVDIFAEYSTDGITFHRPFLTPVAGLDGTFVQEGLIAEAVSNVTRYIIFSPQPARFMRLVFDPDANSVIKAEFIYIKDR